MAANCISNERAIPFTNGFAIITQKGVLIFNLSESLLKVDSGSDAIDCHLVIEFRFPVINAI